MIETATTTSCHDLLQISPRRSTIQHILGHHTTSWANLCAGMQLEVHMTTEPMEAWFAVSQEALIPVEAVKSCSSKLKQNKPKQPVHRSQWQ